MNESSVSSEFQTTFRKSGIDAEVVKHADKSKIGLVDASFTGFKKTLWIEYKFIAPNTKGVTADFMQNGVWSPEAVAGVSTTQYEMAQRLARRGECIYLCWVLDHKALRKRVAHILAWHPITKRVWYLMGNAAAVTFVHQILTNSIDLSCQGDML
jgi:hypothetical protein